MLKLRVSLEKCAALLVMAGVAGVALRSIPSAAAANIALMAGLGDSISAGALADTSTDKFWPFPMGMPIPTLDNPLNGFTLDADFANKATLSWVSGELLQSHYKRLEKYLEREHQWLWVLNFAVSGSESKNIFHQIESLEKALQFGIFRSLPYVTLLVGSNDLCHGVPLEKFRENIRGIFLKLSRLQTPDRQPLRVLVSSIPKIYEIGDERISGFRTAFGYTCADVRRLPHIYCQRMTNWNTPEERAERKGEVDQANEILRAEVGEALKRYPNLELAYSTSVSEQEVDPTRLASDCFHPNARAHQDISDMLWKDQPWFPQR